MTFQVLYSADLHGNEAQYRKLVDEALHRGARAVVIGGDILPKGLPHSAFISGQREFVKNRLPALVGPLKEAGIPLYLMLGNDDCAANLDALASGKNIHGRRLPLTGSIDIVGYRGLRLCSSHPLWHQGLGEIRLQHLPPGTRRAVCDEKGSQLQPPRVEDRLRSLEGVSFHPCAGTQGKHPAGP
ncbi:metallophosphoesterase [Candidatus Woesearchaeota archaeon]|nr:metallophosphoesterase [Candidatus Woesearchaeota archaeon]